EQRSYEIRLHTSPDNEVIAVMRDITERLAAQSDLNRLTYSDQLTGLVNRPVGLVQLQQSLEASKRKALQTAVMCLNVDFFQRVNERHGHRVGDEVLVELARRIRQVLRGSDILARLMDSGEHNRDDWMGGDEFLLVLPEVKSARQDARGCSVRLHDRLQQPIQVGDKTIQLTASIGIACYPDDSEDAEQLIEEAVQAIELAKRRGRNQDCFYGSDSDVLATPLPALDAPAGPRPICARPLVSTADERVVAHRLHPCATPGEPSDPAMQRIATGSEFFSAFATVTRLTGNSTQAFHFTLELPDELFESPILLTQLDNALGTLKGKSIKIDIGISETSAMSNPERARNLFDAFQERGLGAGLWAYSGSSLRVLTDLNMTLIELSDTLTRSASDDPGSERLVATVIHLAHHLGLHVVSGHVDSEALRERLMALNCDLIQGDASGPDIHFDDPK
ncbi:MAG: diguanylate cyclase, partial [Gammaproteobacteria bacterium]|nr:diguanylate cyclase [Gammaproteobacteria bacterium]